MRKTLTGFAAVFMCLFVFTGCIFGKTLEERLSSSDIKRLNDEVYNTYVKGSDIYKDATVEIEGNNITYKVYFKIFMDDLQLIAFKSNIRNAGIESEIEKVKNDIQKKSGIRPEKISFIFYTSDNREIVTIAQ